MKEWMNQSINQSIIHFNTLRQRAKKLVQNTNVNKTNMAAASYHPRILIPKYGQMDNVKPLTANRGLPFAVRWPNLDLKISILIPDCWLPPKYWGLTSHPSSNLVKELKLLHSLWKWITNETYYQRWIFQFVVEGFFDGLQNIKMSFLRYWTTEVN